MARQTNRPASQPAASPSAPTAALPIEAEAATTQAEHAEDPPSPVESPASAEPEAASVQQPEQPEVAPAEQPAEAAAATAPLVAAPAPPAADGTADAPVVGADAPVAAPVQTSAQEPETVRALVLMDCIYGKVDEVKDFEVAIGKAAAAAGYIDLHPNAVAYGEKLKAR